MAQEIGESRETWGKDVVKLVEDFAQKMKGEDKPFYIVYACKEDRGMSNKMGRHVFKQAIRAYYTKPAALLGILVWYVNHLTGEFRFVPELSAPPDVPIDPKLLSDKACDASERVAAQGSKLNVLVS
jgi:hypothetical protein